MGYQGSEYHKGPGFGLNLSDFPPPYEVPTAPDPDEPPPPDNPDPEPPTTPPVLPATPAISRLVLVNATTEADIRDLSLNSSIVLSVDGSALNIRAVPNSTTRSVKFALNGVTVRTENVAPYAYAGDTDGNYNSWTPPIGVHKITATPYSAYNRGGKAGAPYVVNITVTATPPTPPTPPLVGPSFGTQPASLTVAEGTAAAFSVLATGNPAPTYQWYKNGVLIGGATQTSYSIPSTLPGDAGSYTCRASNSQGFLLSSAAILTVTATPPADVAPTIILQPVGATIEEGESVSFVVEANGSPTPTYQWYKNGVEISGETSATFTIAAVATGDGGSYYAIASNAAGEAQSTPAVLLVTEDPVEPDTRPLNYVSPTIRFPAGLPGGFPFRNDPYTLGTPSQDFADYWSDSGQVNYEPDGNIPADPGYGAVQGFAHYRGTYATQPRWEPYRGTPNPDPSTRNSVYIAANGGPIQKVIAQHRTTNTRGNCAYALTEDGFLFAAPNQTGHGAGTVPWPSIKFPASKVVYDVCATSNNELCLVAMYDTVLQKGQLAVIMVEGKGIPFHTFSQMGLFNQASLSAFKLLGYVDLPVAGPFKVAAAANGRWRGPSDTNGMTLGQIDMTSASNLLNLYSGAWTATIARDGYAVVTSQEQNRVMVLDLTPILMYIRESWLSSVASFNATTAARAAGTWPMTFDQASHLKPTVVWSQAVTAPVSVIAGHSTERFSSDRFKFHVGLLAGEVVIFDSSKIMARFAWQRKSATITEMGRFFVGENPCGMSFSRRNEGQGNVIFLPSTTAQGDGQNSVIWVACRGAQKVVEILTYGAKGTVLRTLSDQRQDDPVDVTVCERGYVVLVCDYANKQIVGWRIGNITDTRVEPDVTYPPGQAGGYEISGFLPIPGNPKQINSCNVN